MLSEIRVLRHADGRVAFSVDPKSWWITGHGYTSSDDDVSGADWSELLVAELPEPGPFDEDGGTSWIRSDNALITMYAAGPERADLQLARQDALKELAAVAACERYRQEIH